MRPRALLATLLLAAGPLARAAPPVEAAPASPPAVRTAPAQAGTHTRSIEAPRFGSVTLYLPAGEPRSVALFLSGDGGWELGVLNMAAALARDGAVVVGVDVRHYLHAVGEAAARADAHCQSLAADLELLSHHVQKQLRLARYHVPVLVGYSSGATIVYAALAQSPPGTFAGALSLGFCADQDFGGAALCPGPGLHTHPGAHRELILEPSAVLHEPWIALQGQQDQVCPAAAVDDFAVKVHGGRVVHLPRVGHGFGVERNWMPQFRAAYASLASNTDAAPAQAPHAGVQSGGTEAGGDADRVADLPLVEVPASGTGDELALLVTGDGGWAGLDREIAARFAAAGVPTVGLNSLQYFWTRRTPGELTADVARIARHYLAAWKRSRVLLVGYSFGADVLPFAVNRLDPALRGKLASLSLLGLDASADFEISVGDWLGTGSGERSTRPELAALRGVRLLCIYGEGESDSMCPQLAGDPRFSTVQIGTGHHFGGEYDRIADRILAFGRGH